MTTRAIRGATSLVSDDKAHLHERTQELVAAMLEANGLGTDTVISVFFTCTPDIVSDFPAAAAREMGFADVPLMCAVEMAVPTALPLVVRVMMHADLDVPRADVRHVYLHEAVRLRRDIAQ
ncbi:chorismate mutase [Demequina sp. NBRC 110057]|uniref:chorismate mutase n=1 Tax=Demequina sp. NBRC 110057 TaxID=1570346 RepID=UPI0009FC1243|nr:chorismate mutase [Demequina sp. NBRC 110057]